MERAKSVVYVPYWVKGIFERHNRPFSELLQFDKACEVLSTQELANVLNVNLRQLYDAKFDPKTGLPEISYGTWQEEQMGPRLIDIWRKQTTANPTANNSAAIAKLENAQLISGSNECDQEVNARLFDPSSQQDRYKVPFITYDVDPSVVFVVIHPGFFNVQEYMKLKFAMLEAVLKTLYVYNTYASVCKTPYFRKYLELLAPN